MACGRIDFRVRSSCTGGAKGAVSGGITVSGTGSVSALATVSATLVGCNVTSSEI